MKARKQQRSEQPEAERGGERSALRVEAGGAGRAERGPEDDAHGEAGQALAGDEASDLTPIVGTNLKRFRAERGLSLERLSKASGVSRAMLGQIELGQSTPTINVLWKVARALGVPFSALISQASAPTTTVLQASRARILRSHDGGFSSRALFPSDRPRNVEFYELRLAPHAVENADPHPPGTSENLVVTAGSVEILVSGDRRLLETGDAILFDADAPHSYRNPGGIEAVMYLVMTYGARS